MQKSNAQMRGKINREKIRHIRLSKKLSIEETAFHLGVASSTLCRIETGRIKKISTELLFDMIRFFGVELSEIVS